MNDSEMRDMLIEYMGKGFLENIIALFKQDHSLHRFIPDMLSQENLQVRIGTVALVEELAPSYASALQAASPGLIALLAHENPTVRGDAASVLGLIRDPSARVALLWLLKDNHPAVREAAGEALQEIDKGAAK